MPGIADVARHAGVSKSTASRALTGSGYVSPETRARVASAAEALGYVASTNAVSLATGRTRSVGVILPHVTRWFFAEALEGIQEALLAHDYDLTLYDVAPGSRLRRKVFTSSLARRNVDGVIAIGLEPGAEEIAQLRALGSPFVCLVGGQPEDNSIEIDDDHAMRRATEHLIALGHRRIAFVGCENSPGAYVDRRRLDGYVESMTRAGLAEHLSHVPSPASLSGGYAAAVDVLGDARTRPTAVLAVCDEVAIGTIIAARRLGIRVPTELSVMGIDDHEYADMFSLTTLKQVPREHGAAAVDLLLRHIEDPALAATHAVRRARLVIRNSTAPPSGMGSATLLDSPIADVLG